MSRLYGTLESDKGTTTRAGHRYIRASAQSFDGSVSVEIVDGNVNIDVHSGSGTNGRRLLTASLEGLVGAERLVLKKQRKVE